MRRTACLLVIACMACFHQVRADPPPIDAVPVPMPAPAEAAAEPEAPPAPHLVPPEELAAVLAAARALVGRPHVVVSGHRFTDDCSGFVRAAYSAADVDVFALGPELENANGVTLIRAFAERFGALHRGPRPVPGDVVFFDNTYDRNRNGALDDVLTHVGLVDEVAPDGTIWILHRSRRGVVRDPMNLEHPDQHKDAEGREINAWLRPKSRHDTADTPHLMGELFAGFGTVGLPEEKQGPRFDEVAAPAPDDDDLPPPPVPDVP